MWEARVGYGYSKHHYAMWWKMFPWHWSSFYTVLLQWLSKIPCPAHSRSLMVGRPLLRSMKSTTHFKQELSFIGANARMFLDPMVQTNSSPSCRNKYTKKTTSYLHWSDLLEASSELSAATTVPGRRRCQPAWSRVTNEKNLRSWSFQGRGHVAAVSLSYDILCQYPNVVPTWKTSHRPMTAQTLAFIRFCII